jgi:hypothetical protein
VVVIAVVGVDVEGTTGSRMSIKGSLISQVSNMTLHPFRLCRREALQTHLNRSPFKPRRNKRTFWQVIDPCLCKVHRRCKQGVYHFMKGILYRHPSLCPGTERTIANTRVARFHGLTRTRSRPNVTEAKRVGFDDSREGFELPSMFFCEFKDRANMIYMTPMIDK